MRYSRFFISMQKGRTTLSGIDRLRAGGSSDPKEGKGATECSEIEKMVELIVNLTSKSAAMIDIDSVIC